MKTLRPALFSRNLGAQLGGILLLILSSSALTSRAGFHAHLVKEKSDSAAQSNEPSSPGCQGQLFAGSSEDADGNVGWIFCLDKSSQTGSIYEPPGMLKLEQLTWDKLGNLRFSSVPFTGDDLYYSFQGKTEGSVLSGTLKRMKGSSSKPEKEYQVQASLLEISKGGSPAQRFSNVKYVPEAGELVGAELILTSNERPYRGMVTFYMSYWGEPTYTPLLLRNVEETRPNTIQFSLRYGGTMLSYSVTFSSQSAILSPVKIESWQTPNHLKMKKAPDFLPPARAEGRGEHP